jgi:hypothetical protein
MVAHQSLSIAADAEIAKRIPFGAVVGVLNTVLQMIEEDATHVAVATLRTM